MKKKKKKKKKRNERREKDENIHNVSPVTGGRSVHCSSFASHTFGSLKIKSSSMHTNTKKKVAFPYSENSPRKHCQKMLLYKKGCRFYTQRNTFFLFWFQFS